MKLLILGATGRTGQRVVMAAREQGHHVTTFGRRASDTGDRGIVGGFDDPAFGAEVRAADAVLSCLASSSRSPICSVAAQAAIEADPTVRYLTVAGAGVDRPEDRKGLPDKAVGLIMRLTVGKMLADRQAEVDMLAASAARWTALRPPRLTEGRATGMWRFDFDKPSATWIDRDDLAAAMLSALSDDAMIGRAPFVSVRKGDKT